MSHFDCILRRTFCSESFGHTSTMISGRQATAVVVTEQPHMIAPLSSLPPVRIFRLRGLNPLQRAVDQALLHHVRVSEAASLGRVHLACGVYLVILHDQDHCMHSSTVSSLFAYRHKEDVCLIRLASATRRVEQVFMQACFGREHGLVALAGEILIGRIESVGQFVHKTVQVKSYSC